MARVPVWADVCRNDLGEFAAREVCALKAMRSCSPAAVQVTASAGTAAAKQMTAEVAKRTVKSVGPIAAAFVVAESLHAGVQCWRGKITKKEAIKRTVCSVAGGAGGVGGATLGAIIGAALIPIPGVGTTTGCFLGGMLGNLGGRYGASKAMA